MSCGVGWLKEELEICGMKIPRNEVKRINTREELRQIAKELGVRPNWHEPDEQDLEAEVRGSSFDNAGFWGAPFEVDRAMGRTNREHEPEMYVRLYQGNYAVADVNLAMLFAWACGLED